MRTVVTGGCGFIGSHVVNRLVAAGHEVSVVDNSLRRASPDVDYRRSDISDVDALTSAFEGADAVFHLAAVSDVDKAAKDPVGTFDVNVGGTAKVLEAARRAGVSRTLLASTVWVYGATPGEGQIPEEACFDPQAVSHVYTASKLAAEMTVHSYHELYGMEYTILRYGIPYGPGMRDELVVAKFIRQALAGQPLTIAGDGLQYRNYLYVEDLADAHALALRPDAANQVIALEGAEPVSIRHIAESLRELIGSLSVTYGEKRAGDFAGRAVDAWKAAGLLGWKPETPFTEGLKRCVEWYQEGAGDQPVGPPA